MVSRGDVGSFGTWQGSVVGDVGIRFGGSEHHRIGISSSHTRHRPYGQVDPGGRATLFGASHVCLDGAERPTSSEARRSASDGAGRPTSSEARRPVLDGRSSPGGTAPINGVRHAALFGVSGGASRGVTARDAPRSDAGRPHGTGNPALFGVWSPPPHGTGNPELFGASSPPPHGILDSSDDWMSSGLETGLLGGTAPLPSGRQDARPSGRGREAAGAGTTGCTSRTSVCGGR